ncbi:PucC family protein [Phreatobacter oligotrophus]|uniref:BCD family chlorophyll transporter-like MFS transporter n=1 Tax=Phreatobacter oligotrophus TaxID=1122261 RepID=A0A2T4Z2M2_9HYPH|nr:PucC family protein [Phreatobacter oligotrophus]PTM55001.1 BCD family chlorophyll transporter-like MFS transporter [Phreatobacter oligotrophus]
MIRASGSILSLWRRIGPRFLPFADAASAEVPLSRLVRLSLFQVSVGMATVLLVGTLNRVMIVELKVPASLVAIMVALPLLVAPFRAFIGFRSDTHVSALGWRRVPYIWMGSLLQFGGLAIMPFALLVLSGDGEGSVLAGQIGAALAFLLVGAGLQTTQTAGLALATDITRPEARPRVVALMYVMLLVGMLAAGAVFGVLLTDFSAMRLIQVIQGAALATMVLNVIALWKQEARDPSRNRNRTEEPSFREAWGRLMAEPKARRFLVAVGLGTAAFNMQDIILEPYGGEVIGLSVSATTGLTVLLALGALLAFALAGRLLARGFDPARLSGLGGVVGIAAFTAVILAAPLAAPTLFRAGAFLIGFGGGLFAVGTLTYAMGLDGRGYNGLALGAWGAVQATAAGLAVGCGGILRDLTGALATRGALGPALTDPSAAYAAVYHLELFLLFAMLIALGPLVGRASTTVHAETPVLAPFGLSQFPR